MNKLPMFALLHAIVLLSPTYVRGQSSLQEKIATLQKDVDEALQVLTGGEGKPIPDYRKVELLVARRLPFTGFEGMAKYIAGNETLFECRLPSGRMVIFVNKNYRLSAGSTLEVYAQRVGEEEIEVETKNANTGAVDTDTEVVEVLAELDESKISAYRAYKRALKQLLLLQLSAK